MKNTNKVLAIGSGLCLVAAAVLGVYAITSETPTPRTVHILAPTIPDILPTMTPVPYAGPVDFTVKATATMKWSPVLDPANFVDTFQLVDEAHGFYATGGTQYLIAHAYSKGFGAPGNTWEALKVGQVVGFKGSFYRVNMVSTPSKKGIAGEPVWTNDPDMLVMITCLSRGAGYLATNNIVVRLGKILPTLRGDID